MPSHPWTRPPLIHLCPFSLFTVACAPVQHAAACRACCLAPLKSCNTSRYDVCASLPTPHPSSTKIPLPCFPSGFEPLQLAFTRLVHWWVSTLAADVVSDRPCIRSPTWAGAENPDYPEGTLSPKSTLLACLIPLQSRACFIQQLFSSLV